VYFRNTFLRLYWLLSNQFGLDVRKMLRACRGLPRYLRDYLRFHAHYAGHLQLLPCLHDWYEEGGLTKNEYFWQDLLVARMIFAAKPDKHVDIGSRVDGFVAHVASFREIEVLDIRPINLEIPGIIFKQADLMQPLEEMAGYCDSLSCLHALEHFGLGRYGDQIDPEGFGRGFTNMVSLLRKNGVFYLSVPIGIQRVEFNAHRVFDPHVIINLANRHLLRLTDLILVKSGGFIERPGFNHQQLSLLASQRYALGIFIFRKHS